MGALSYYKVIVKFRNEFELSPNRTAGFPSPLEPVFEYHVFLNNNETWENDFSFSFSDVSFEDDMCTVSNLMIGESSIDVRKTVEWNATSNAFHYQLLFELWIFNATVSDFQYHNRWVGLWLNMSQPSQLVL